MTVSRPWASADRLILTGAVVGFVLSLALHLGVVAGLDVAPVPPWAWLLHAGAVGGFWLVARRITAAGLRGVAGFLRMRRAVPLPVRLTLAAATLNALAVGGLAASGRAVRGQAGSAYWTMMYLLVAIVFGFVVPRVASAVAAPPRTAGRADA